MENRDRFKYRAWDKACNEMIALEKDKDYYYQFKVTLDLLISHEETWCTGDLILMQCTGLRDKNEKLIYEGDLAILDDCYLPIEHSSVEQVYWDKDMFLIDGYSLSSRIKCAKQHSFLSNTKGVFNLIEVIGNIYENPDLIGANPCDLE